MTARLSRSPAPEPNVKRPATHVHRAGNPTAALATTGLAMPFVHGAVTKPGGSSCGFWAMFRTVRRVKVGVATYFLPILRCLPTPLQSCQLFFRASRLVYHRFKLGRPETRTQGRSTGPRVLSNARGETVTAGWGQQPMSARVNQRRYSTSQRVVRHRAAREQKSYRSGWKRRWSRRFRARPRIGSGSRGSGRSC